MTSLCSLSRDHSVAFRLNLAFHSSFSSFFMCPGQGRHLRRECGQYFFPFHLRCCLGTKIPFTQQTHIEGERGKPEHRRSHGWERAWSLEARKTTFKSSPVIHWESAFACPYFLLLTVKRWEQPLPARVFVTVPLRRSARCSHCMKT